MMTILLQRSPSACHAVGISPSSRTAQRDPYGVTETRAAVTPLDSGRVTRRSTQHDKVACLRGRVYLQILLQYPGRIA